MFPRDYFSPNNPNDGFTAELDAVIATEGLDTALLNYDEFIEGAPLKLSKDPDSIYRDVIYRGWMMKPEQYRRFCNELKEFVDLKLYDGCTNEWRDFIFNGVSLGIKRNSNQPEDCSAPPHEYLSTQNIVACPFYTVDYAELDDGSWTIIETGDGQVSGLAASDNPTRFYEEIARRIRMCETMEKREVE